MSESITKELREYARNPFFCVTPNDENFVLSIADNIDERFTHELEAKQAEIDALKSDNAYLQARLDASILPPVDIDGVRWTGEDVDKPFSLTDGDKATEGLVREIAYDWPRDGWFIVDQYDTHYPADRCRHVAPEPPEPPDSQERIDADAGAIEDGMLDGAFEYCMDHGIEVTTDSADSYIYAQAYGDLLRRQRELDVAGEQA